ncbi:MAG TPA: efflux RND transporter permease subunit, partial [Candidatus Kapabacteria bacterium]|nr:efflux RND transporter permease subunit [Candidatus Kapabacteria bacterium]
TTMFVGDRTYDVNVRFKESVRDNPDVIGNLTIASSDGANIPLAQVADISLASGESVIDREMGHRHMTVRFDLRGRDVSSFLAEARASVEKYAPYDHQKIHIGWEGEFENQQRAESRIMIIIPIVLALIFLILYAAFGNVRHATIILLTIPMAASVGGFIALNARGMTLNVSSAVGFIALFGVAVQNGVLMVANINRWRESKHLLEESVIRGAFERLRPVLMTSTVAIFGLTPAALTYSIGSDVQRPLATVIVGGLITDTALLMVVLPAVYYLVERRRERKNLGAIRENLG